MNFNLSILPSYCAESQNKTAQKDNTDMKMFTNSYRIVVTNQSHAIDAVTQRHCVD